MCALIVGMAKVGVAGIYVLTVPVMAYIFGGKDSTGVMLPILIMADIFGVAYYSRSAKWKYVIRLMPPAFIGLLIGVWAGEGISDQIFKLLMGTGISIGLVILIIMEIRKSNEVPDSRPFGWLMGGMGGFATMVGNSAGPILMVYLLAMRLPKNVYIGTVAWLFMIINWCKVPFHIWVWKTMDWNTLLLDLCLLPIIALGTFLGFRIVKLIPDHIYRYLVLGVTCLSAILLFL
ncbi:MAG: sulfite exporter TauE/SafE family protein [Bacteroidota bacterium]